jgi:hypothetical protein
MRGGVAFGWQAPAASAVSRAAATTLCLCVASIAVNSACRRAEPGRTTRDPYADYRASIKQHADSSVLLLAQIHPYAIQAVWQHGEPALRIVHALYQHAAQFRWPRVAPPPEFEYAHSWLVDALDSIAYRADGLRLSRLEIDAFKHPALAWWEVVMTREAEAKVAVDQYLSARRRISWMLSLHGVDTLPELQDH